MTESVTEDAANLLEELGLQLYRVADDKEALDDALDMADRLREVEPELGELQFDDPKPMEEVEKELDEWINGLGITEGDTVLDRDGPSWSNGFEVVRVTDTRADEYVIGTDDWGEKVTVAAENPNYAKYDRVIEVTPIDGNNKEYAYPASRLAAASEEDLR